MVRSGRNSNLSETSCMSSLPVSTCIKRIRSKVTEKRWRHHFPHYKSMRAFCCHRHQTFDPICLKTLYSLCPHPVMLHIKFDQDRPTVVNGPIWPKFELVRDFMHILVTCKYKKDHIKNNQEKVETLFSLL